MASRAYSGYHADGGNSSDGRNSINLDTLWPESAKPAPSEGEACDPPLSVHFSGSPANFLRKSGGVSAPDRLSPDGLRLMIPYAAENGSNRSALFPKICRLPPLPEEIFQVLVFGDLAKIKRNSFYGKRRSQNSKK